MDNGKHIPVPRRLLARMRDAMAGAGTAEERLHRVVGIISDDMAVEVCSVYVRRAGDVLELFATQGLLPTAVHQTRLRVGEGLVGDIAARARPLATADAQSHPSFAFRPETGEEIYRTLMGVPILRAGRVIGVVVVQSRASREHTEEEIETLQTVAMVLAELISGGGLIGRSEFIDEASIALVPRRLDGSRISLGLGMGFAVMHQPRFNIGQLVAEDPAAEQQRLRHALAEMQGALDDMLAATDLARGGEHRDILETYRMIAQDAGWVTRIDNTIKAGLTAEAAVQRVQNELRARLSQSPDRYLRERVQDLEDLANRLLQHLLGANGTAMDAALPEEVVVVARSMGPAQLLDYGRARLRGLVLEEGSPTAHVAVVARALDIPIVGNVRDALGRIESGSRVIVDGDNAQVHVRPGEDIQQTFRASIEAREQRKAVYASQRDLRAVTLDGERVKLNINSGLMGDSQYLKGTGADGIGLYRTEIPFMTQSSFPDVETQQQLYREVVTGAGRKPVVFRTLDIGGDKVLPYWDTAGEENPAMGWRAIRVSLDRPAMLRQQLRALIRTSVGRELRVMFPMIAQVTEFDAARRILDMELRREEQRGGTMPKRLRVGAMLEVPALIFQLPALLRRVDFISVGSNDLIQFMFASDRGNQRIAERYDPLSPLVFSFLRYIVDTCRSARVPVSLCGEMAGRPLDAMALIGLGFRDISVSPPAVGPVKAMIRSLSVAPLADYLDSLYDLPQHSVREKLRAFALDHGVMI
jgi:phosphotransferase system, enzyme I, PtsP